MRVTTEQYQQRTENRITGVYVVREPNTFRRGRKQAPSLCDVCGRDVVVSHCENCGRETEFLFPGFKEHSKAALKFRVGGRVRFSESGKRLAKGVKGERLGTVRGFFADGFVVIREDGCESDATYDLEFWDPIDRIHQSTGKSNKLTRAFQTQEVMVCAVCRPPSNWEIEEILHGCT